MGESTKRVVILMNTFQTVAREMVRGIARYAATYGPWELHPTTNPNTLRGRDAPDGVIFRPLYDVNARVMRGLRLPAVNIHWDSAGFPRIPRVYWDDRAIGEMAARYLLDGGFERFAFCAEYRQMGYSLGREKGFAETVRNAGGAQYDLFDLHSACKSGVAWPNVQKHLGDWLAKLQPPVGVLTATDLGGVDLLIACRRRGLRVPEDVCVLSAANDDLMCEVASPPLSAVEIPAFETGYEAAAVLHRMMKGEPTPKHPHIIAPKRIVERRSSDMLAIDDALVVRALRFIRDRAAESVSVADVLGHVPLSRRALELRFKANVG
ncbi:MAG TPA: XylR family transcriptional regulator, partial [Phycisphaerae bacterium]|nr:XylR family transcriptional regulator [Phycisphaerae bacterium]